MTTEMVKPSPAEVIETVLMKGDLGVLTDEQRVLYVKRVCESLRLNHLTRPFIYIRNRANQLILYATRDCTEQLRKIHGVSVVPGSLRGQKVEESVYVVTLDVTDRDGRTDSATGAVSIAGLRGEDLANAIMKAETKAKRRATLSICGLGMLDESEVEDWPAAAVTPTESQQISQLAGRIADAGGAMMDTMEWNKYVGFWSQPRNATAFQEIKRRFHVQRAAEIPPERRVEFKEAMEQRLGGEPK